LLGITNRVKTVTVAAGERVELERWVRCQTESARGARIVLPRAALRAEIAELVGWSVNTAGA
jgi:hypothetical protein